jgi:hypothetical protein
LTDFWLNFWLARIADVLTEQGRGKAGWAVTYEGALTIIPCPAETEAVLETGNPINWGNRPEYLEKRILTTKSTHIDKYHLFFRIHSLLLAEQSSFFLCRTRIDEKPDSEVAISLARSSSQQLRPVCLSSILPNKEGMFQPQPTPYSPFSSYGAVPDFHSFQPSATGRSALVVDSGGPTIFRDPIFSPVNVHGNANANNVGASNFNNTHLGSQFKMAANGINDLEQQEELARSFQPDLQVCGPSRGEM